MRLTGRYNPEITIYLGQRCGHEAYRSVFTGMTLALTSSRIILTRLLEKQRYVNEIVALLSLTLSIYNFILYIYKKKLEKNIFFIVAVFLTFLVV